jgi:hypothetical protein
MFSGVYGKEIVEDDEVQLGVFDDSHLRSEGLKSSTISFPYTPENIPARGRHLETGRMKYMPCSFLVEGLK